MNHPYAKFENTALWKAVEIAVGELEHNQDVHLKTARNYVVGLLCEQLAREKIVTDAALGKASDA
jgi:hypothetical protein